MAQIATSILHDPLDPAAELAALTGAGTASGGLASFVGQVRAEDGLEVLELEHYPGVTDAALAQIAGTAAERWPLHHAVIRHRVGRMTPGEPIVFVAASAAHRRAALDAVGYMIDCLKTEAPFWKRVHTAAGSHWVEATDNDRRAADAWLAPDASNTPQEPDTNERTDPPGR